MDIVKQVIYTSTATCAFPAEDLRTLVEKARLRNAAYGVSGLLLFHTGSFIQLIEGEDQFVDLICTSIARDSRHNWTVLSDCPIDEREFDDRPMAFANTALSNSQPSDLIDFFQLQPLAKLDVAKARQYLHFFYKDICCER